MKKVLMTTLLILMVILGIILFSSGIRIGSFEILSYAGIDEKNKSLDTKITDASRLTSVNFPQKVSDLTASAKKLTTIKEQYKDKVAFSSEADVQRAKETKVYQVEFIFTRLGNYAKKNGIKMDLVANLAAKTISFTLHGKYALISEFVRDIENDSQLNFTVQNFKLTPDTNNEILKAEFIVPDVPLEAENSLTTVNTTQDNSSETNATKTTTNNKATNNNTENNAEATNKTGNSVITNKNTTTQNTTNRITNKANTTDTTKNTTSNNTNTASENTNNATNENAQNSNDVEDVGALVRADEVSRENAEEQNNNEQETNDTVGNTVE